MEQDVDGDGAINLSTSQRPSAATTPTGGVEPEDVEQQAASLEKVLKEQQQQQHQQLELDRAWDQDRDIKGNGKVSPNSDNHRLQEHSPPPASDAQKTVNATVPVSQSQASGPPMMPSPVSGLHHMQQLLQQHVLNPTQLQTLMKQHSLLQQQQQHQQHQLAELGKKQIEQTMQQLQEQLQLNLIQQTHILQSGDKKKASNSLQQLALQQQQLIQQLQLVQRQYMVHQGIGVQSMMLAQGAGLSSRDVISPWKELANDHHQHNSNKSNCDINGLHALSQSRTREDSLTEDRLEGSATTDRVHHLYGHNVCKWPGCEVVCEDFQAFLKHLNTEHTLDDRSTAQARVQMQVVSQLELQLQKERDRLQAMMHHLHMSKQLSSPEPVKESSAPASTKLPMTAALPQPTTVLSSAVRSPILQTPVPNVGVGGPIRRRISDKSALSLAGEIQRNREFYKNADVRPPFTYASLIRQSIIESPDKQLTLNEIYNWFQNTFCYFRRNAATWKNAVRHNLSLHKCFMRVENVKGAVWTVDEVEFYKRRPQRCSSGPLAQPVVGSSTSRSPTMNHSPTMYSDQLTGSLQCSQNPLMEENSMGFLSSAVTMTGREPRSDSPSRDHIRSPMNGGLHIKQESMMTADHHAMRDSEQQVHHLIKREMHTDYDDLDQEHHSDAMAEDLSLDHGDSNVLDT